MEYQASGGLLGELTLAECLDFLASREVGRLAVVVDGQPTIFPVNYVLDDEFVVFRTDPGTKLDHGSFDNVAFEIDEIDTERKEGWSVVVAGMGREITDALDSASEREQQMLLEPWASGAKQHWVRIISPKITGRRIYRPLVPDERVGEESVTVEGEQ